MAIPSQADTMKHDNPGFAEKPDQFTPILESKIPVLRMMTPFKNGPSPASFRFSQTTYRIKTVDLNGIQTPIVREEGEQADHMTH